MSRFSKKIEELMSAISFAEEGEFEKAREILREDRRVLLALNERAIDSSTLKYATNTCKRVGANLDILMVSQSAQMDSTFEQFLFELTKEGIQYRLIQRSGCLKEEIINYTNGNKGVLFVVIESSDNLNIDRSGKNKKLSDAWQNLNRPLVVVMDRLPG